MRHMKQAVGKASDPALEQGQLTGEFSHGNKEISLAFKKEPSGAPFHIMANAFLNSLTDCYNTY